MLFPLVLTFELPATVNTDKLAKSIAKYRALLIRIKQKLHKKRYQFAFPGYQQKVGW